MTWFTKSFLPWSKYLSFSFSFLWEILDLPLPECITTCICFKNFQSTKNVIIASFYQTGSDKEDTDLFETYKLEVLYQCREAYTRFTEHQNIYGQTCDTLKNVWNESSILLSEFIFHILQKLNFGFNGFRFIKSSTFWNELEPYLLQLQ